MDGYADARRRRARRVGRRRPCGCGSSRRFPPGHFPTRAIGPGECARIFTGAPLPEGADTVVRQEDTDEGKAGRHHPQGPRRRREHPPRRRGRAARRHRAAAGHRARRRRNSACSRRSRWPIRWCYRRPRVAILGSGDEIVDVDQPEEILSGRKIASSNTHTLVALVRLAGGEPVNLGIARDTPREPPRAPGGAPAMPTCSSPPPASASASTTTCGRCSRRWAATQRFWKLRMRPGRAGRLRAPGRRALDRPAGQPGQHDGDLRALRAARHPEDVRPRAALPPQRPVRHGRAGHASSRGCSTSSAACVTRRRRRASRPGSPDRRGRASSPRW